MKTRFLVTCTLLQLLASSVSFSSALLGYDSHGNAVDVPRFMLHTDNHNVSASCSANEECTNLDGDCCPTVDDVDLFCCGTFEDTCATNPECAAEGLEGACCPAAGDIFLACCDRPAFAACEVHPDCHGLAGDCCPTASGVVLDCCLDDLSLANLTFPDRDAFARCDANSACVGLDFDCCPTRDGVYLYCCGESERNTSYAVDLTLVSPNPSVEEQATYFASSSPYIVPAFGAERRPVVEYTRNSTEVYDLIYYETDAIPNAGAFTSGRYKFYMDVWTDAPPCTQIMIQLDALSKAFDDNFPFGRHSRYVSFTTMNETWERIEFDFFDRLDEGTLDTEVDAFVLFFAPGLTDEYTWYFDNLDIAVDGCSTGCEEPSLKNCSAYFGGEEVDFTVVDPESEAPSAAPSSTPSTSPSSFPSALPTSMPSSLPTSMPSAMPSTTPSMSPSSSPSAAPSNAPSASPSDVPTFAPTTSSPTGTPTATPTTASPTSMPTEQPTDMPSSAPSGSPTSSPSDLPSVSPTGTPTSSPSGSPSMSPSISPTFAPTEAPSDVPSSRPTPFLFDAPSCADERDNDRDGLPDCEDPDCFPTIQCGAFMTRSYQAAKPQLTSRSALETDAPTRAPVATNPGSMAEPTISRATSTTIGVLLFLSLWMVQ